MCLVYGRHTSRRGQKLLMRKLGTVKIFEHSRILNYTILTLVKLVENLFVLVIAAHCIGVGSTLWSFGKRQECKGGHLGERTSRDKW